MFMRLADFMKGLKAKHDIAQRADADDQDMIFFFLDFFSGGGGGAFSRRGVDNDFDRSNLFEPCFTIGV